MKKIVNALGIIMVAVSLFLIITHIGRGKPSLEGDTITVVTKDTVYDTITLTKTKLKEIERTVLKTDTLFTDRGDTVTLHTEAKTFKDTLCSNADTAILQVHTRGIDVSIDSVNLELRKQKELTTITKIITKKQHFFWGPTVGVGYGVVNNKPDVFIGVSVGYRF